jgi:hypothetical protein
LSRDVRSTPRQHPHGFEEHDVNDATYDTAAAPHAGDGAQAGAAHSRGLDSRTRWLALMVLCLGNLMIVLDTTIVNVALPSIRADLGFSESSLAWVVNAYLLTFGGFLLLGGRLGDLLGHRRMFVTGIAAFTTASVACGLAGSPVSAAPSCPRSRSRSS